MKRIIALALVMLLMLTAVVGCGKKETVNENYNVDPVTGYVAGKVEGQIYENASIGLKYTADEETYMSGEEEIRSMMELTADTELTVMYEMFAINAEGNIIILTENLENEEMSEEEYLDNLKAQLGEINMVDAEYGDNEKYTIGDLEFTSIKYPVTVGVSDEMYQCVLVRKFDDRMLCITLTYTNDASFEVLMSGFSSIE